MAYNTVAIKKDIDGKPIPQYYDAVKNEYEVLQGTNGASKAVLYDAAGNEINLVDIIKNAIRDMEYYGKSTDTKPTANITKGSTYFEIDTTKVYMWDGSGWVVI